VQQLKDGTYLAQRLGLGATGPTYWDALQALIQKESLHCDHRPVTAAQEQVQTLATTMREGLGELLDWMEG
jgi:hypothetical protein